MSLKTIRVKILKKTIFNPVHFGTWLRKKYFDYYLSKYCDGDVGMVLDAGCGRGEYSRELVFKFPNAIIDGRDVKNSDEWKDNKNINLIFREQDLTKMEDDNSFDLVVSVDVLEHIVNNKTVMKKIFHSLRQGGFFYLTIPCERNNTRVFPDKYFSKFREWTKKEHIGEQYDLEEMKVILKDIGFKIIFARYTFTFFGNLAWELEFIVRESNMNQKFNILLMPVYKFLGILDFLIPIGKGNNLIIAQK